MTKARNTKQRQAHYSKPTDQQRQELIRQVRAGASTYRAAKSLGIVYTTAMYIVRKYRTTELNTRPILISTNEHAATSE